MFKTDAFIMKSLKFPIPCIFLKDTEFSRRRQNQSRSAFVSSDGEKMLFGNQSCLQLVLSSGQLSVHSGLAHFGLEQKKRNSEK